MPEARIPPTPDDHTAAQSPDSLIAWDPLGDLAQFSSLDPDDSASFFALVRSVFGERVANGDTLSPPLANEPASASTHITGRNPNMSLRGDIADILENFDGSDYMEVSDAIIAHLTSAKLLVSQPTS